VISVPVKLDVYPGLPHAFNYFTALSATKKYGEDMAMAIKTFIRE
jgi:hypothetical protein